MVELTEDVRIYGEYEGRSFSEYVVMLQIQSESGWQTIALVDNAHGSHEMHRYTGSEKQPAEPFFEGAPRDAMPAAIAFLRKHWKRIARAWTN